ncbi:MAG: hypothetical protein QOD98_2480 [Nocardioidaceae bacterium]|nr:hypothetical protein [Nocardioidaceae bacterium]
MRRRQAVLALVLAGWLVGSPAVSTADTAGGANGPIVFTADSPRAKPGEPAKQMWTINPDGTGRHEILPGRVELNTFPRWSPDGRQLAFYRKYHLIVADADGSQEHEVLRHVVGGIVSWSPDGTRLAYVVQDDIGLGSALWVVNVDGTDPHEIYRAERISGPSWSPRGDEIAFSAAAAAPDADDSLLYVIGIDGTGLRQLTAAPTSPIPGWGNGVIYNDVGPRWSPDASLLLFGSDRDADCVTPTCGRYGTYLMAADGTGPVTRLIPPGFETAAAWSPDGKSLLTSWWRQTGTNDQPVVESWIQVRDLSSGAVHQLASPAPYGGDWSAVPGSRPTADLGASLTADATSVLPGSPVTLTATIRNSGPAPAEDAAIEVRAAPGSTLGPDLPPGCAAAAGGALTCVVGTLAPGAQTSVTVRSASGAAGVGDASALATSATLDPDTTDNRAALAVAACTQVGTPGPDRLRGTAGADVLCGGGGDDVLFGRNGNDVLLGGPGRDRLVGGGGKDASSYAQSAHSIRADLAAGRAAGDGADRLVGIEGLVGSAFGDRLAGSPHGEVLVGGAGADRLTPRGGSDRLDGGLGVDRVDYRDAAHGIRLDLDEREATGAGDDRWVSVEGAWGSRFADVITGSRITDWVAGAGGDDVVDALDGGDRILGGAGADLLDGGNGDDRISGGSGVDRCRQAYGQGRPRGCERN